MANATRPGSSRKQRARVVRCRDVGFPSAPSHVSGDKLPTDNTTKPLPPPKSFQSFQPRTDSRVAVPQRPSTSGGVSTRKLVYIRETRDDLHFNPATINLTGTTFYNFPLPVARPTPASLPTPALTPRTSYKSGSSFKSLPPRTFTPDSSAPSTMESHRPSMEIGMAIGSPTHLPTGWSARVRFGPSTRTEFPEWIEPTAEWKDTAAPPKAKNRWNIFGRFGKKPNASPANFYQLQPEELREPQYMNPLAISQPWVKQPGRTRTVSERKTKTLMPEIRRAQTVPLDFEFDRPASPKNLRATTPEIRLESLPISILDVEIPSIKMERYSVMFGSVLKPQTTQTGNLLARRQATLDKLKTVNEAIDEHERREAELNSKFLRPRRGTSPQPTKSPAFSLFPSSARTQRSGSPSTPHRSSPLQRSNTSPAALSPNRQTFASESRRSQEEQKTMPRKAFRVPDPIAVPAPAPEPVIWSADESHLDLHSPASDTPQSALEAHNATPLKPELDEPDWEMIAPPSIPDSSINTTMTDSVRPKPLPTSGVRVSALPAPLKVSRLPRKTSKSGLNSNPVRTQKTRPDRSDSGIGLTDAEDEAEALIKSAADVSIARQISISQSQRQMLVPIKTRMANAVAVANGSPVGNGKGLNRDGVLGAGGPERLGVVGGKPMTPTLVSIGPGKEIHGRTVNRNSERAFLGHV